MTRVLVVDDEREIAQHIAGLVFGCAEDCRVEVFTSGTKALHSIGEQFYDLVVSDIAMPVTDGFAILNYIAENSPSTEVIFLTAHMEFDYIYNANKVKQISYIVKTESDDAIRKVIADTIAKIRVYQEERKLIALGRQEAAQDGDALAAPPPSEVIKGEIETIERVKSYIAAHVDEDLTAGNIAERFHYNASYLSRIFRFHNLQTLSGYIMSRKIHAAKQQLRQTAEPVQAIAASLGYQSSQAFARAFKRETGLSPQEYRHASAEAP